MKKQNKEFVNFPCLGIVTKDEEANGTVVLFWKENVGAVVLESKCFTLGEISKCWDMDKFVPLSDDEEIILSNY